MKKYLWLSISLSLLFSWFVATVFIDFVAVPSVFRTVSSLEEAGSLGIKIFGRFNYFEIVFSLLTIVIGLGLIKTKKKSLVFILTVFSLSFPLLYWGKLTPEITKYNKLKAEYIDDNKKMEEIQPKLDFYHKTYVRLDSLKLLVLLTLIVLYSREIYKLENHK